MPRSLRRQSPRLSRCMRTGWATSRVVTVPVLEAVCARRGMGFVGDSDMTAPIDAPVGQEGPVAHLHLMHASAVGDVVATPAPVRTQPTSLAAGSTTHVASATAGKAAVCAEKRARHRAANTAAAKRRNVKRREAQADLERTLGEARARRLRCRQRVLQLTWKMHACAFASGDRRCQR
jgi:hypothetical protein